ncbi:MAG: riboflavin synthase [Deltaproteobacteria bacterium]|nr:riboflavin synthase [Deltaproteobacteria bacterium]
MFTGLIEGVGRVKAIERAGGSGKISVESSIAPTLTIGASIAVDGVCLSVTSYGEDIFSADISYESLHATTLSEVKVGGSVNLERPLTATAPLGGHFVTGHVDCKGTIKGFYSDYDAFMVVSVDIPEEFRSGLVHKGSVTVDGISLTVSKLTPLGFETSVIPETLKTTTLGGKGIGASVNIETDILGKYVLRYLEVNNDGKGGKRETITEEFLSKRGFINK